MRKIIAGLAVGATLVLTGCGSSTDVSKVGDTPSDGATPVSAPSAEPIPKSTPTEEGTPKSPRGNFIANIGDVGSISSGTPSAVTTKFTVNAITPATCTEQYSRPAVNGQIILVDITVETTPELANDSYPKFTLSGHDFKYIAPNGTTFNGDLSTIATYSCIPDAEQFPSGGMGPAEKVTAKVVLDLPAASGILVMSSGGLRSGGFEYNF